MQAWRDEGRSLPGIAKQLNDDAVPTPAGGREWYAAGVRQALLAAEKRQGGSKPRTGPKPRTLTIQVDALTDEQFVRLANSIWFVTNAAVGESEFFVQPGRVDDALISLMNEGVTEQPEWGEDD
ncbi:MAG: Recombinase [Frankiales bacterium]|nr:Recombinase [Frankiales bacterium]